MLDLKVAAFADEASKALDGQIAAMKRNGISMLEIRFVDADNISVISTEKAKEIRRALDANGLSVWSIGSPTGKIKITDDFAPHFDQYRHQLELGEILGAKHYRLFSFYETDESGVCFDRVCERLERFVDAVKGTDMVLCHENEKGIYGDVASRCVRIHQAVPALKAVFDPANFLQCGEEILPAWEQLSPYVEYLHIKDCNAEGKVVPPGTGLGNLPELLKRYAAQGGSVCTLEPHLTKFIGLDKLENGEKTESAFSFANSDEAFDAAAAALNKMILEG
ncbi:MAG: sugar phosphate isomerase/epimerase [Clostridia bacterium]|nr:sugar phosphate isomerase/epimerase [Clostridia bacterium]